MRLRRRAAQHPGAATDGHGAAANTQLSLIETANRESLDWIAGFRERFARGEADFEEFSRAKHDHPFMGFVPCRAQGIDFVMFHANDDIVVWEYLWFGDDSYESEIVEQWVAWARDSSLVFDIGAYTGLMSILAAKANPDAAVHLFEPMDRTVERAKVNIYANSLRGRVKLHNRAASDAAGKAEINLYRDEDFLGTGNSIYDKSLRIAAVKTIECVVVDDYLPGELPDLVKIDVEGHELAVLQGMSNTIKSAGPRMIVEVWEHTRSEVLELLRSWDYECEPFERTEQRVMNYRCERRQPSGR